MRREQKSWGSVNNEWAILPFSEAVLINPSVPLEHGKGYPFVDMQAIDPNSRSVRASHERVFTGGGSRFAVGDTLMARITPCLENGKITRFVDYSKDTLGHGSTEFIVIRGRPSVSDTDFAYYLTRWDEVRFYAISQMTGSSGRQRVPTETLRHLEIPLPPLCGQRAIAHILGTLDDKIELNRRINETLEAMARAIFKSWFVDFDPVRAKAEGRQPPGMDEETFALFPDSFEDSPLGKIPKRWHVLCLGDITFIIDCLHSKKPERQELGFPLLQLWNICDNGLIDMTNTYFISEIDYRIWISRIEASPGDCIITNVGRVGAVAQIPLGVKAALGRNMTGIRCKDKFPYPTFLIQYLLSQAIREEINLKTDTGSILEALNVRNIPKLRLVIPSQKLIEVFEMIVRPLRKKMETNLNESSTLTTIRDALLPKLLSGEIRVNDAERFLKERGL